LSINLGIKKIMTIIIRQYITFVRSRKTSIYIL
jgi:hypothetical protein